MADILIINSPLWRDQVPLDKEESLPAIGLGYIASVLEEAGKNVKIIDAVNDNISVLDLLKLINNTKPQYVALNIFTTNFHLVKEVVENSYINPIHFIIGGLATKSLYRDIALWGTTNNIDIVIGDGEKITLAIIENSVLEEPYYQINNHRVFNVNMFSLYYSMDISTVPLNRNLLPNEPQRNAYNLIEAHIVTGRGCIYNCAFCAAANTHNEDFSIRESKINNVISELDSIRTFYPQVESIRILDDLFLKDEKSVEKAIQIFDKFKFRWRSTGHIMTFLNVDHRLMCKLKDSGCYELFIGIESGSTNILKGINKTSNINYIKQSIINCFRAGISIKGYFIYGFPGETKYDFEQTYQLATSLKAESKKYNITFRTSVFQYRPYHGTSLFKKLNLDSKDNEITMKYNHDLSLKVNREEYNFYYENFADADIDIVHEYIRKTNSLNDR